MNLLLDTHVLLWSLSSPDRLGAPARRALENPSNVVFFSPVSAWEMEIKQGLGKLSIPGDLPERLAALRFTELPLRLGHVRALRALPPLHRDPFDRILVAQARADQLTLVSHDERVLAYPVQTLRV
jgi:PIN domain nuclease of toxin-antitoxin system